MTDAITQKAGLRESLSSAEDLRGQIASLEERHQALSADLAEAQRDLAIRRDSLIDGGKAHHFTAAHTQVAALESAVAAVREKIDALRLELADAEEREASSARRARLADIAAERAYLIERMGTAAAAAHATLVEFAGMAVAIQQVWQKLGEECRDISARDASLRGLTDPAMPGDYPLPLPEVGTQDAALSLAFRTALLEVAGQRWEEACRAAEAAGMPPPLHPTFLMQGGGAPLPAGPERG